MKVTSISVILAALLPAVSAHGDVTSPKPRSPGPAFGSACSQQALNQQTSDHFGNVQSELQVATQQKDYNPAKCNFFLCKGYQFDDNKDNVQAYTAGQKIDMTVEIRAPHTGVCNVSIVDTAANSMISPPLISFNDYASNSHPIPANNTAFSITMPDLGSKCSTPGACVIQWFWDAPDIKQTYESCIDFTMGGSTGGGNPVGSSSAGPAGSPPAGTPPSPANSNGQNIEPSCGVPMAGQANGKRPL